MKKKDRKGKKQQEVNRGEIKNGKIISDKVKRVGEIRS